MDDIRIIMDGIKMGWRWNENGIYYSEVWKTEDETRIETETQRTARVMKDVFNSILHFLNLTIEIKDDFDDEKLPTLDLKIWIQPDGRRVLYEHYEKPMKTNLVLQQKRALSENIKVSSLSQEVVRTLLNCSEELDNSIRVGHLNNLAVRMCTSGYRTLYIRKIFICRCKIYTFGRQHYCNY